jgi:tetratricopeptide (TPR) repeat protein
MRVIERWSERAATPAEARAASALAGLRAEPDLDAVALQRLHHRIAAAVRPRRRRAWRWQPAVVALLVLGVAGIAAATIGVVVSRRSPVVITPLSSAPPQKSKRAKRRGPLIVAQGDAAPVGPPAPPAVEPARPVVEAPKPAAPRAVPPAPAKAGDGEEVRLFSEAMRAWRSGDARGALVRIEDYEDLYPEGHFAPEAILVKVDALQALGRSNEALSFLRYQSLAKLPRSTELEVIRAELSAKAGRCDEALIDLDQVLRRDPGDRLGARALYARASCRSRLGDEVGAETDLRLYLLRYPNGPHVVAVRRALAR